ncbi:hypothetical protein PUNSTDRAFT_138921 [Punctularia strigosozonata HHB-11173 SS5]|uniref:F-box domain-containing protein n=1 Tax=Punctularia strigosozonata (strain HHB-11173) TaxID=741275 RepID=R7S1E3_PUNST|nr:uncharacterized protein PUNSTDRAFT_138921 [Punctularia strigosozonata HHB-11173 SS5]EIN04195.1 hypothetical protein PUNSTDRAFT_138921 [Punctularia strigosozonata HHB-11173 SS5]
MSPHCPSCRCMKHDLSPPETLSQQGTVPAVKILDDRIKCLVNELCQLRRQRNTLQPISRLPPEVLLRIFVDVRKATERLSPQWIKLTHVCSFWRDVALSSAILWNSPDLLYPELAEETVRRSRGTTLRIMHSKKKVFNPPRLLGISSLETSAPITSIDLTGVEGRDIAILLNARHGQLSQLREIAVEVTGATEAQLHNVLTDDYPCLQSIQLRRCHLEWTSALVNTTTCLHTIDVHSPHRGILGRKPFSSVLTVLQLQTRLVHLDLELTLPSLRGEDLENGSSPTISLPKLKHLRIHDLLRETHHLFTRLRLSPSCCVTVSIAQSEDDYSASSPLLPLTESVLAHAHTFSPSTLAMLLGPPFMLVCVGTPRAGEKRPLLSFRWPSVIHPQSQRAAHALLISLGPVIGALPVSELSITFDHSSSRITYGDWRQLLVGFEGLRSVRLETRGRLPVHFLQVLADYDENTPRLLPHMQNLVLTDLELGKYNALHAIQGILPALTRRCQDGVFRALCFSEVPGEANEGIRTLMEGVAPLVVWGGDVEKW